MSECETYRIMSRLHPGQHVAIVDHDLLKQVPPTTTTTVKKHKKKVCFMENFWKQINFVKNLI